VTFDEKYEITDHTILGEGCSSVVKVCRLRNRATDDEHLAGNIQPVLSPQNFLTDFQAKKDSHSPPQKCQSMTFMH
jgi:hypothetical protein